MKSRAAQTILDESYLETRAKLLEVAATLDRIDRARHAGAQLELAADASVRREQLISAIRILLNDAPRRAEDIQQLFSRHYDPQWRDTFGLLPEHAAPATSSETPSASRES